MFKSYLFFICLGILVCMAGCKKKPRYHDISHVRTEIAASGVSIAATTHNSICSMYDATLGEFTQSTTHALPQP